MKLTRNLILTFLLSSTLAIVGCKTHRQYTYDESGSPSYASANSAGSAAVNSGPLSTTHTAVVPQSVTQGLNVPSTSQQTADNAIIAHVREQLAQDATLATAVPNIQISFQNGAMTLSGNVPSTQEKEGIEAIAKNTSGVLRVDNQLQVSGQSAQAYPPENKVALPIISETPGFPSSQQSSTAGRSETALKPTSDRSDTTRVYADQMKVEGITEADRALGQQIAREMRIDGSISTALPAIKLTIDSGKVTIHGSVASEEQRKSVESIVKKVTGVTTLDNQLQISSSNAAPTSSPSNP